MTWQPSNIVLADLGFLQVVVNHTDVTYFRGVPTEVSSFDTEEPFGDGVAEIIFPQITPFEAMPSWFVDWANVEINLIPPTGPPIVLFEGLVSSIETQVREDSFQVALHCMGALHQLDNYVRAPSFQLSVKDIGQAIYDQFDRNNRPALRTGTCNKPFTGVGTSRKGFWNPSLTGYIQDLLSYGTAQTLLDIGETVAGGAMAPSGDGYYTIGTSGTLDAFGPHSYYYGGARDLGQSNVQLDPNEPLMPPLLQAKMSGMAMTPTGKGYWLCALDGGVFAFGDAPYLGNPGPGSGILPSGHKIVSIQSHPTIMGYWVLSDHGEVYTYGVPFYGSATAFFSGIPFVDFSRTPAGDGYVILNNRGQVYAFGSASFYGNGPGSGTLVFNSIAYRPQGDGYWLLANYFWNGISGGVPWGLDAAHDIYGEVYGYGAAVTSAWVASPPHQDNPASDIVADLSGNGFWVVGDDGGIFTGGNAQFYGSVPSNTANVNQWTLTKLPGRIPHIMVKDSITENYHVTNGTPGIQIQLSRDYTHTENAVYGEGVDVTGCHWRNSKFPVYTTATPPVYPGYDVAPGNNSNRSDILTWQHWLQGNGFPRLVVTGVFDGATVTATKQYQATAGVAITGTVTAQTWAAAFQSGQTGASTDTAYFAALVEDPRTDPYIYNTSGAPIGPNPVFDPDIIRIERFVNLGEKISKSVGVDSATNEYIRDGKGQDPGWTGQITLTTDPEEASRFLIKAGENIVVKSWMGRDVKLHIAHSEVSLWDQTVTLTVDERNRDLMTLGAVWARDRDTNDLGRRQKMHHRTSRMVRDTAAMWDCIPVGTMVATLRGWVAIEQVVPGDRVWSWNEEHQVMEPQFVEISRSKGIKEVFEIKTDRRTVSATANHKLFKAILRSQYSDSKNKFSDRSNSAFWSTEWVTVDQLAKGDQIVVTDNLTDVGTDSWAVQTVQSINPAGSAETWDIQVANTHNFIAEGVVVHNCEGGSGVIPRQGIKAGVWNVVRIPSGERGDVAHTSLYATQAYTGGGTYTPPYPQLAPLPAGEQYAPAHLAMGIFDAPITAIQVAAITPTNSTVVGTPGDPNQTNFWDWVNIDSGLIIGWGGENSMGGFYPFQQSDPSPTNPDPSVTVTATGVLQDDATWYYLSTEPPWLWVAIWSSIDCFVEGMLYPSTTSQ